MDIFERFEAFPEIHNIAFIPLNKNEPPKPQLIHAGTREDCEDKASFTKEQKAYLEGLIIDLGYYGSTNNLKFVSFNELREQRERFCQKCLHLVSYFNSEAYTDTLNNFLNASEKVKNFREKEIFIGYNFFINFLKTYETYKKQLAFIYGPNDILIPEIGQYFKKQLDIKTEEITESILEEKCFEKMEAFSLDKALKGLINEDFIDDSVNSWLSSKTKQLKETIKTSSSYVLYEENFYNFFYLQGILKSAVTEKKVTKKEASFFIQLILTHTQTGSEFVSMPYHFFLARIEVAKKLGVDSLPKKHYIILDDKPTDEILETCRTLIDYSNEAFNTYEKVYNIAVNL